MVGQRSIFIETDLEPDDALAIAHILHENPNARFTVIVGEGDSRLKSVLLHQLFNALDSFIVINDIIVVEGFDSELPYPNARLDPDWVAKAKALPKLSNEQKLRNYIETYTERKPDVTYFLKPPREALLAMEMIDFSSTECITYGGFNYRVTGASVQEINNLARRFQSFWHCSRRVELGPGNDIFDVRQSGLLKAAGPRFEGYFRALTLNWNHHYNTIVRPTLAMATDYEIVIADLLCLCPTPKHSTKGELTDFDNIRLTSDGPILVTNLSKDKRHKQLIEYLTAEVSLIAKL